MNNNLSKEYTRVIYFYNLRMTYTTRYICTSGECVCDYLFISIVSFGKHGVVLYLYFYQQFCVHCAHDCSEKRRAFGVTQHAAFRNQTNIGKKMQRKRRSKLWDWFISFDFQLISCKLIIFTVYVLNEMISKNWIMRSNCCILNSGFKSNKFFSLSTIFSNFW